MKISFRVRARPQLISCFFLFFSYFTLSFISYSRVHAGLFFTIFSYSHTLCAGVRAIERENARKERATWTFTHEKNKIIFFRAPDFLLLFFSCTWNSSFFRFDFWSISWEKEFSRGNFPSAERRLRWKIWHRVNFAVQMLTNVRINK